MKSKTLKNIISSVCFIAILVLLISLTNYIVRNKNEAELIYPYYQEKENSLDAIFIGSSHIMCGVFPMDLWNDYGIASYDYTSSALVLPQAYYQMIEALKTQKPKVLVIDVSGAEYENTKIGSREYVHVQLDNTKWSVNKINAINDLIEDPDDRLEYYFPFIKFHSRWKDLSESDFKPIKGTTKGAHIGEGTITVSDNFEIMSRSHIVPLSEYAEEYLRKILDHCKEQNINAVLLNTPSVAPVEIQGKYNAVEIIANEYGVPYLNLMHELDAMGFDLEADMRDEYHCNVNGGQKVTRFVGEYLKNNYALPDRREDANYSNWHQYYKEYKEIYPY
ncbi:MAG: SGNH/GDSL hydrolase family protein [Clostridia bacterium]|nr:SGNH/GDSL hydrolase family protein [Clostridia bacterium]